jgi:hypothetical protein
MEGSLTVIGPMTLERHLTAMIEREATDAKRKLLSRLEQAEKVFYLASPQVQRWFEGVLPDLGVATENLQVFYAGFAGDPEVHLEVAEWVLQAPRLGLSTCAVFSGPWDVCAPAASACAALALAAGITVTMLPDILFLTTSGS